MSELDEAWAQALAEAERRARVAGRGDVAEYIALRASNDHARSTAIEWLGATFTIHAGEANRAGAGVTITRAEAHRFRVGNSTMVGPLLTFRSGVRALMIEAGWPRTPRDGFIRGGGLACAQIKHLGLRAANEELMLLREPDSAPQWFVLQKTGTRTPLLEIRICQHLARFLDAK
jgi:hypothetical protein